MLHYPIFLKENPFCTWITSNEIRAGSDNNSLFHSFHILKGPYANHILIPQGSTGSSKFFDIKWKPIFFWFQIQNFRFKFL